MIRIGDVELAFLSDGTFRVDAGGLFGLVPKTLWQGVLPPDEDNCTALALRGLLIVSAGRPERGKRILVDTGMGRKLSPEEAGLQGLQRDEGDLLDNLQRLGLSPADIDIVINTHLHADHSGGNTLLRDGVPVPTFPNAEYWVQRQEWADACYPNERTWVTYLAENLLPVQAAGQLRLVSGNARVTEHVRTVVTRGHSRGHQSVVIESGGETAVLLGDLAVLTPHLERLAWISAYDSEPLESLESKRAMRDWVLERHALLLFEHDPRTPMGYLINEGDRFRVRAP